MRLLRRIVTALLFAGMIAAVLLGANTFIQSRGEPEPQESPVLDELIVGHGELRVTVGATGAIAPARQTPLLFEAPGFVSEVLVQQGDRVAAGDVLARLDTADLDLALRAAELAVDSQRAAYEALTTPARAEDVAVAEAAVNAAQAALGAAYGTAPGANQVEIARLQTELARNQLWQAQLQRDLSGAVSSGLSFDVGALVPPDAGVSQDLIDQVNSALAGLVSVPSPSSGVNLSAGLNQAEYGVAIADASFEGTAARGANAGSVAQAQGALASAQAALDRLLHGPTDLDLQLADLGLRQAELALAQARATLAKAVLTAPFDGVVAQVNLVAGEPPSTQAAAVVLIDDAQVYLELAVDETDVVEISAGQPVELRFDALPDAAVTGIIDRVAEVPVVAGQLVTYPVRVALDPTSEPVRLGMTATATVIVRELADALVVPNRFIRLDRTTQQAYVTIETDDGLFTEIPVELGVRNQSESEVLVGLEAGQRLVIVARSTFDPFSGPPR